MDDDTRVSQRFHMKKDGRTFVMYGPEKEVRELAALRGYTDVCASGHYEYKRNIIIGAQDGPVVIEDMRTSGRERG